MSRKKVCLAVLYTLALLLILWYPVGKILRFEFPAVEPVELKFKATVYDPYDPMRGRYVRFQVLPDTLETTDKRSRFDYSRRERKGYAVVRKTPQGFAELLRLEKDFSNVKKGEIAVKVKNIWYNGIWQWEKNKKPSYKFEWPFDRFYLNELKAPALEAELQNSNKPMVLKVKIFPNGDYMISGLERN